MTNNNCSNHVTWRKSYLSLRVRDITWLFLINCLLFQNSLTSFFDAANYIDEAFSILVIIASLFIIVLSTKNDNKNALAYSSTILSLVIVFIFIGLVSNHIAGIQLKPFPIAIDLLTCIKFILAVVSCFVVFSQSNIFLYNTLTAEAKLILIIMLPFAVCNEFFNIGMRFDRRFGLFSFQFIFGHPSFMVSVVSGFLILLGANIKSNRLWLLLCWLYLCLSLRITAIAFAAIAFFLSLNADRQRKIKILQLSGISLIAILVGWRQLSFYANNQDTARYALAHTSLLLAQKYSPFGSGFATFGSHITAEPQYYSELYYQYGLNHIWGLSPSYASFISDSFWPTLIGQFGWLGFIVYVAIIILLFKSCLNMDRFKGNSTYPTILTFVYMVLTSIGSSSFFSPSSLFIAVCLAISSTKTPADNIAMRLDE